MSELTDSLSQWRGYADDGHGIAIGFKGNFFSLFNIFFGTEVGGMFSFDRISYGITKLNRYFNEVYEFEKVDGTSASDEVVKISTKAIYEISNKAAFFKNDSFKEEKEWRIAVTLRNYNFDNDYFDFSTTSMKHDFQERYYLDKFRFISTIDKLIPHIELPTNLNEAISEIIIGPKSNVSIRDMQMFLIANGLLASADDNSIAIKHSASSYR